MGIHSLRCSGELMLRQHLTAQSPLSSAAASGLYSVLTLSYSVASLFFDTRCFSLTLPSRTVANTHRYKKAADWSLLSDICADNPSLALVGNGVRDRADTYESALL